MEIYTIYIYHIIFIFLKLFLDDYQDLLTTREINLWAELQTIKDTLRMTEEEVNMCNLEKLRFLETLTKSSVSIQFIEYTLIHYDKVIIPRNIILFIAFISVKKTHLELFNYLETKL